MDRDRTTIFFVCIWCLVDSYGSFLLTIYFYLQMACQESDVESLKILQVELWYVLQWTTQYKLYRKLFCKAAFTQPYYLRNVVPVLWLSILTCQQDC
ncbi:hypothetical protein GDO78_009675 [Eleutherodactylus coqui]|uniref:Uncharacterized protein n=1 Tax=Eleutherodactylus coqui TaxID=57060 RepID=A0A8J6FAR3_ELECQ|nr:hypothetical protein GDO78_009675 [Eleutherodactylus coqui]